MSDDITAVLAFLLSVLLGFSIGAAVMLGAKEDKSYYQGVAAGLAECRVTEVKDGN